MFYEFGHEHPFITLILAVITAGFFIEVVSAIIMFFSKRDD